MKLRTRRNIWSGIGAGWLLFLLLAAFAYLTPARLAVMRFAGRDHAALLTEANLRRQVLVTLHPTGASPDLARDKAPAVARARSAVAETETRLAAWRRVNSGISPFGFLGWVSDLWPWILGLGFALPVLGGLIGAQVGAPSTSSATSARPASSVAMDETKTTTESVPESSESPAPSEPAAWAWNARPVVRSTPARPKAPPVKSPHGSEE